jgi:hypothetical protein
MMGMSVGTLKALEENTIIEVARVNRERRRDAGKAPTKFKTICHNHSLGRQTQS